MMRRIPRRLLKRVQPLITVPMGVKLPPYFDPAHHAVMAEVIGRGRWTI